jgi:hypothetical protein
MDKETALYSVESELYKAFRALDQAVKRAREAGLAHARLEQLSNRVYDQLYEVRRQREACS